MTQFTFIGPLKIDRLLQSYFAGASRGTGEICACLEGKSSTTLRAFMKRAVMMATVRFSVINL